MIATGREALGFLETQGMVPAIYGADSMLKAANVELESYENVGSTLVTIIVRGDVAACQALVQAGVKAAASIGKLTAHAVMPSPAEGVNAIVAVHTLESPPAKAPLTAPLKSLGMVETFGVVHLLEAVDAMIKAADVELIGYENVGSQHHHAPRKDDHANCQGKSGPAQNAVAS